jgi:hypothetical protein
MKNWIEHIISGISNLTADELTISNFNVRIQL